ncbi:MAG: hypothetical protein LC753_05525 [Acidobacteria bacterium]|nr:hypothetical protein [Acidobacteriota bacterium]
MDRAPADASSAQPHQRTQPLRQRAHVEELTWRERVEVAGQDVQPVLVSLNTLEQRA